MSTEFEYDVFLSHASEDKAWCAQLAERLRNDGVRVWFDQWHIQPGHNIDDRINDGLEKSRKLVAVWTEHYFADRKVWTLAESYAKQHEDALGRERLLIPLLRRDCKIKPTLQGLLYIDFRNDADSDLRYRQLVEALDLPNRERVREEAGIATREKEVIERLLAGGGGWPSRKIASFAERAKESASRRGKRFENEVATLYRLLGFDVKLDIEISGVQMDVEAKKREGGAWQRLILECKDTKVDAGERDKILARQVLIGKKLPKHRVVAVSSTSFAAETRAALDDAGVDCTTYPELLRELVPLDTYAENLIAQIESEINDPDKGWGGRDLFIRPDLETDVTYERRAALTHFAKWLGDPRANLLVVLGDLGTGKTTLARFLAYQLARSFRDDPLRHPAPVLIPLREVRKEVALDSIVTKHFRDHGLPGVSFPRFEHLLRQGKIVLFFDAFDEMADRVRWEVTQQNFQELRRAGDGAAKVVLTCRTHYFKDRTEQAKLIGQGPSLNVAETALYKELRQQSNAEVVYLQEFNDAQIQEYLQRTRGKQAETDWQKIQTIYNLKDLASRPLLLDMIVKSLPHLKPGEQVNAANLYQVYTNLWVERDFKKGRVILNHDAKLALMMEIAAWMWQQGKFSVTTAELVSFVSKLHAGKALEFGEEEADDIAREVQAASFLRRDHKGGEWHFMHRSFGEFFLARKILNAAAPLAGRSAAVCAAPAAATDAASTAAAGSSTTAALRSVLNTRRLDRKVIYFLTLLDEQDMLLQPLQAILTAPYTQNVSENALEILYWSGRVRCGSEEEIGILAQLRTALAQRLPTGIQLPGADLREIVLEGAGLRDANLEDALLVAANLNNTAFQRARMAKAQMPAARLEDAVWEDVDLREANLASVFWRGASLTRVDLTGAIIDRISLSTASLHEVRGAFMPSTLRKELEPVVQFGSPSGVNTTAFSREADLLAVGGGDGVIRLYRASDGRLLRSLEGHKSSVTSVAFDRVGCTLASGSHDRTVNLWEAASGRLLRSLEGHEISVTSVAFDPAGRILVSGSGDTTVKLWEVASGRLLRTLKGHEQCVLSVAFDPEGCTLASGSWDHTVKLWEVASGRLLHSLEGHKHYVSSVAFDPEGCTLASGSEDHTVKLWEVASGRLLRSLEGYKSSVYGVAFDPTGRILASGSHDKTVRLWESANGRLIRTLEGHQDRVRSVAFDPSSRTLASGSEDTTVKLWEAASGRLLRSLEGHHYSVWSVAFDPAGRTLVSGSSDNKVKLWEVATGRLLCSLEGHQRSVFSVAFDPAGRTLASASLDKTVRLWEVATGALLRTLEGHRQWILSVTFDPAGHTLASGSEDNTVKLWETASGRWLRTLQGHQNTVTSVAFDPAGRTLASGSEDRTVKLWEAASGKLLRTLKGHQDGVRSVAFDPAGHTLASGSGDNTFKLWEAANGRLVRSLEGHQSSVTSVAFDQMGHTLASGSEDHTVKLWEKASGKLLASLEYHLGPVHVVKWAPNGKYLVAAGASGRLQFWDTERLETFLYLYAFGPGAWLALLPDGRFDGTPDALRYLCYTERGTLNSFTAEGLVKEFHDPKAVKEVLARYHAPIPA